MDAATVDHHGRTTAYRLRDAGGEGPTILCIHGSGGSHAVWRGQFRLAGDYPVAALDLSGHGDSDDIDAEPGYETLSAYVDDVVAVADATGASVLVGNSLGGAVVMTLALERDLDLDALVLTGTGAKLAVLDDLLNWLDDDFDRAVSFLHGDDKLFHSDDERFIDGSKQAMYDAGQAVTSRDFRSCHTFDVRDTLDEIAVPTLALVGEHDRLTPPSYHEYLADSMPDCEMATIADAAHLAMLEQPAAFNAAVKSFLDQRVSET
ncbi:MULTISPECIES: alpha/beta fold hydrolase [Haloferax]|uniref:Alpha/beta fold hydrolase n=2 Tax=Haloferax TaxID=2251 RepID=A0A6G1Z2Q9_9EURY|nr:MULTISPECIES: alpha/beta hydrolase [Haloferax]KAB1188047.1 alpha/beta hydrolase [Haloferax sp. CBA1149]MRW80718.1 alpha/beta fold hydrolase [Haloferax marinisediminis]